MRNSKGSILAITIGFALVFTMLGAASIYMSTLQNETQEKQILSQQAFWLAEAEIQRAVSQLPDISFNCSDCSDVELGDNYNYTITTGLKPGYHHRWVINSIGKILDTTGFVTLAQRKIQVEAGPDAINAFQTTGTLKPGSEDQISPYGSYSLGSDNFTYTFEELFGSLNSTTSGVQVLTNPKNNQDVTDGGDPLIQLPQNGIIWVNGDFMISSNGWNYGGILIVNGNFIMTGGSFTGMVWVNGAVSMIEGNPGVVGAVFVNDPNGGQTKIDSSSSKIVYSALAIDQSYDLLPSVVPPETYRHIMQWEEIN